ncbi:MAG: Na(+)-translocating NADH-quinone reductase subunit A [Flavobacteriaceae bacterium]|nr:Na(+)-translocating NADH-quinone reductase subunit A [Flavobacteriaceae bacterium]
MSKDIRIRKGFNLNLDGEANKILVDIHPSKTFALKPADFFSSTPKLLVKEGAKVEKGTPLFFAKENPRVHFVSPVSGEVTAIVRGAKRKILEVVVTQDDSATAVKHEIPELNTLDQNQTKEILLKAGAWPFITQRPYGTIARPEDTPKAIFVSTYTTAPLDVDYDFLLKNNKTEFQKGIDVLAKLTDNLTLTADASFKGLFENIENANIVGVSGNHPAGNVGVQIHHLAPVNAGEIVWVVNPEDVANIGALFMSGEFSAQRTVALVGSSVGNPQYYKATIGSSISALLEDNKIDNSQPNRFINGDVLTGTATSPDNYLGFYNNLFSIIPEGNNYRMFGWLPFVDNNIPSMSKTSLSWLFGKRKAKVNTNLNGEERALVVTGEMEKVLPMDIYPMQLLKACMVQDVERMEALGIYEVVPQDFALVDYSSTSKIEAQEIIKQGIELMIKEEG